MGSSLGRFQKGYPGTTPETAPRARQTATGPGATFINGNQASAFSVSSNGCASGLSGVGSCTTLAVQFGGGPTVTVPLHGSS